METKSTTVFYSHSYVPVATVPQQSGKTDKKRKGAKCHNSPAYTPPAAAAVGLNPTPDGWVRRRRATKRKTATQRRTATAADAAKASGSVRSRTACRHRLERRELGDLEALKTRRSDASDGINAHRGSDPPKSTRNPPHLPPRPPWQRRKPFRGQRTRFSGNSAPKLGIYVCRSGGESGILGRNTTISLGNRQFGPESKTPRWRATVKP